MVGGAADETYQLVHKQSEQILFLFWLLAEKSGDERKRLRPDVGQRVE